MRPNGTLGVIDHRATVDEVRPALVRRRSRPPRVGSVRRRRLVRQMLRDDAPPIVVLSAPPGYGKTTVLTQWSARQPLPVAWLTAGPSDCDPRLLLDGVGAALGSVGRDAPTAAFEPSRSVSAAVARLLATISGLGPVLLVLDQVDSLEGGESAAVIGELATRLPGGSRLALATRGRLPLPMALLRSRGEVLEVGTGELAMTRDEGRELLDAVGARLDDGTADAVIEHAEGWPVALYLAGLAARNRSTPGFRFDGGDRRMGDYLRSEVLAGLSAESVSFLTRTSVLDQLAGPVCDAVLDAPGSQALLESLEAANVPLVPLDQHRAFYRCHRLMRDLLAADLRRHEPELGAQLHSRAAAWYEAHHLPERAVHHAQAAGDAEHAARLVAAAGASAFTGGRVADVGRWVEWFPAEGISERYPNVAVLGALTEASLGRPPAAERWAALAEPGRIPEAAGRCAVAGWRPFLRAFTCRGGALRMRTDARRAQRELSPWSPLVPGAILLEAVSLVLEGDQRAADPILAHAHDVALDVGALPGAAMAAAERALIAIERGDWPEAATLAARGLMLIEQHGLQDSLEAVIVFVASARSAIHAGDLAAARALLSRATRVRPLLTYAAPWTAHFQLELARIHLELGDTASARAVLRDLGDVLRQRPDLGTVATHAAQLRTALDAAREHAIGATSLTAAELRLLPFLATHLSFPEIGERLTVSRHTVKTQAISIYRKLGVSSRSEAISRAHDVGLLPGMPGDLLAGGREAGFTPTGR
jgi:LuxR family transcriptional regulator, maltose regulon positive regulatory protein